jgi:hypothetical protein
MDAGSVGEVLQLERMVISICQPRVACKAGHAIAKTRNCLIGALVADKSLLVTVVSPSTVYTTLLHE